MPDAPPTILANGSGSTPASPVQIAANGSGSSPAAPVQVAANGSGSTPSAPPVVTEAVSLAMKVAIIGTLTDGSSPVVFPLLLEVPVGEGPTYNRYWTNTGISYPEELGAFYHIGILIEFGVGSRWSLEVNDYTTDLISPTSSSSWESDAYPADEMPDPWLATGWAPSGIATGTPVVTAAPAGPAAPAQVAANASVSTPAAPVQIAANGGGSTPASPVQIAANGSGSTPAAPPVVVS